MNSTGIPAHASQLWEGKNALVPLCRLGVELSIIYERNNRTEGWETTMNIGQIHGGISTNQVCPEAFMKLDFRYQESDSVDLIINKVKAVARKIDSCLQVNVHMSCLPMLSDHSDPTAQSFIQSLNAESEKKIEVGCVHSSSDARHFHKCDARILMLKPVGGGLHSDYEWIDVDSCMSYYRGVRDFIFSYKGRIYGEIQY